MTLIKHTEAGVKFQPILGFPKIRGTFFGGPINKDYSILGSILGSHYFGKLPYYIGLSEPGNEGPVERLV